MIPSQEINGFADLNLNIDAQLDRTVMTLRDLLALGPNSTIKLSRPAGDNIDLLIGDTLVCSGEIVIVNETIGVRITDFRVMCPAALCGRTAVNDSLIEHSLGQLGT